MRVPRLPPPTRLIPTGLVTWRVIHLWSIRTITLRIKITASGWKPPTGLETLPRTTCQQVSYRDSIALALLAMWEVARATVTMEMIQELDTFNRYYPRPHDQRYNPSTCTVMAQNSTFLLTDLHKSYLSAVRPWYYDPNPQLWSPMPDFWLSVVGPVAAYWLFCGFFEILDRGDWEWLQKYKIHESREVISRNKVTKRQVLLAVILQQVTQMALGYFCMDPTVKTGGPVSIHLAQMEAIAPTALRSLEALFGRRLAALLWHHKAQDLVYYVYWWAIPLAQLLAGL